MSSTALKKIWEWLKTIVAKLPQLLPRRREIREEPAPHVPTEFEEKLGREIQRKQTRRVDTRRGGPRMPKRQPCPSCNKMVKRKQKTMGGAHYYCNKCKNGFFVKAK